MNIWLVNYHCNQCYRISVAWINVDPLVTDDFPNSDYQLAFDLQLSESILYIVAIGI